MFSHNLTNYSSDLESVSQSRRPSSRSAQSSQLDQRNNAFDSESRKLHTRGGASFAGLDAYSRHKKFINDFVLHYGGGKEKFFADLPAAERKTDYDVLREEYKFVRTEDDDDESVYEKRLAKRYYDKLFKEYCIGDFSRYKHGQIGLRWRVKREVFSGKGQFVCGNLACDERKDLCSFEVNFAYLENKEKKNTLVKIRLCPDCAYKLNYKKLKELEKKSKKEKGKEKNGRGKEEENHNQRKEKEKDKAKESEKDMMKDSMRAKQGFEKPDSGSFSDPSSAKRKRSDDKERGEAKKRAISTSSTKGSARSGISDHVAERGSEAFSSREDYLFRDLFQ
tara:strand:+ start:1124 stop:2131 length:1008 start_codon:yes stop_codon:yes gene_type:complete